MNYDEESEMLTREAELNQERIANASTQLREISAMIYEFPLVAEYLKEPLTELLKALDDT